MRYILLCLSFLSASAVVSAQSVPQQLAGSIDSVFGEFDQEGSPGCALGIYRQGKLVYAKGFGEADIEHGVPVEANTIFDIGSTSKQFTAACILLLQKQGKLSLDDDIRKFFPDMPDYGTPITIRNLLNHTSGLRDYIGLMVMQGHDIDDVTTPDQALDVVLRQKGTDFPPGTRFSYSNTGYFLASRIVEIASGQTLRDYAAEYLFGPLGMVHTAYVDDHTMLVPHRASAYASGPDNSYVTDVSRWEQNGDGGVFTSVEDLLLWDQNFYTPRVGGVELPDLLQTPGMLADGEVLDYGLGLFMDTVQDVPVVLHGGAWGGYRAELVRVPSAHTSVAVLCNCGDSDPTNLAFDVLALLLPKQFGETGHKPDEEQAARPEDLAAEFDPALFEAYEGDYELEIRPGFILTMMSEDGRYYTQATGQPAIEIVPSSDSTFFLKGVEATITFHREADGSVDRITLFQGGAVTARRVKAVPFSAEEMAAFVGTYYSSELNLRYVVEERDGALVIRHPVYDAAMLQPVEPDVFSGNQWYASTVRFVRDEGGSVDAMQISAGRVEGLEFRLEK